MKIDSKNWEKLRRAIDADDREEFEHLITTITGTAARDEIARRSEHRRAAYIDGKPYLCLDR